jgi:uncharacterized protein YbaR (Trm112 family)
MANAYSIAFGQILYINTVSKEVAMNRIVCPFCHAPLAIQELETATIDKHACLVCPECENVLVSEAVVAAERPKQLADVDA